jgi:hypothetical protein
MAKTRAIINTAADNFQTLYDRVNELVADLGTEIITANTDAGGGATTGNAFVTGILGGTTLTANAIRGGTVATAAPLNVTSNLVFDVTKSLVQGNVVINSTAIAIGANVTITPALMAVGNSTVNSVANSSFMAMSNPTATANITLDGGFRVGQTAVNSTHIAVGANTILNTTALFVGNSTVNTVIIPTLITVGGNVTINSSAMFLGNSTANASITVGESYLGNSEQFVSLTPGEIRVGNSTVNAVINSMGLTAGLQILDNITLGNSTINVHVNTTTIMVGANVKVNSSSYFVGNSTVSTVITNSSIQAGQTYMTNTTIGVGTNVTFNVFLVNTTTIHIGNSTANATVNNNAINVRGIVYTSANVITSGTSAQLVDSWTLAAFQAVEYTLTVKNNGANGFQYSKIAVLHDTVNAHITEYAIMVTNAALGSFTANANATHVALWITPVPSATTVRGNILRIGV